MDGCILLGARHDGLQRDAQLVVLSAGGVASGLAIGRVVGAAAAGEGGGGEAQVKHVNIGTTSGLLASNSNRRVEGSKK